MNSVIANSMICICEYSCLQWFIMFCNKHVGFHTNNGALLAIAGMYHSNHREVLRALSIFSSLRWSKGLYQEHWIKESFAWSWKREHDILPGSPLMIMKVRTWYSPLKVLSTPQSSTQGHTSVRQHLLIWHEGCTIRLQCSKKEGLQLAADDS